MKNKNYKDMTTHEKSEFNKKQQEFAFKGFILSLMLFMLILAIPIIFQ